MYPLFGTTSPSLPRGLPPRQHLHHVRSCWTCVRSSTAIELRGLLLHEHLNRRGQPRDLPLERSVATGGSSGAARAGDRCCGSRRASLVGERRRVARARSSVSPSEEFESCGSLSSRSRVHASCVLRRSSTGLSAGRTARARWLRLIIAALLAATDNRVGRRAAYPALFAQLFLQLLSQLHAGLQCAGSLYTARTVVIPQALHRSNLLSGQSGAVRPARSARAPSHTKRRPCGPPA